MTEPHQGRTVLIGGTSCAWTCAPQSASQFFAKLCAGSDPVSAGVDHVPHAPSVIVTDENVRSLHGRLLPPGMAQIVIPPGEASKTFDGVATVLRLLLDAGLDRGGTVIAFGGGVVSDLAGFAAATFMRGIRWIGVPTTLLAMVDASIGGKTAVDVDGVKNLAGVFHPPDAIVADPLFLSTLPGRERAAGMAEVVKQAVIGSERLFERLEHGEFDDNRDVAAAARVKIEVVERDPFERGERAVLNLGHTVGHGVETASNFTLTHGEAVAVGLVAETCLAERLAIAPRGLADRIRLVLARFGLPSAAALDPVAVRVAMSTDKKRSNGRLRFSLPRRIGDVARGLEVDERVLVEVLREVSLE